MALKTEQEIVDYLDQLERESKALKQEIIRICWYMRGSVTLEQAWNLTVEDRKNIGELINDNLEVVKKTGLPFF